MAPMAPVAADSSFLQFSEERNRSDSPGTCHSCHDGHPCADHPSSGGHGFGCVPGTRDSDKEEAEDHAGSDAFPSALQLLPADGTATAPLDRIDPTGGQRLLGTLTRVAFAIVERERRDELA